MIFEFKTPQFRVDICLTLYVMNESSFVLCRVGWGLCKKYPSKTHFKPKLPIANAIKLPILCWAINMHVRVSMCMHASKFQMYFSIKFASFLQSYRLLAVLPLILAGLWLAELRCYSQVKSKGYQHNNEADFAFHSLANQSMNHYNNSEADVTFHSQTNEPVNQHNNGEAYFAFHSQASQLVNWTQTGPTVVGYPKPYDALCSFELCRLINKGRAPVKYTQHLRTPCAAIYQCVTLITKTRYRLSHVANLITSFHKHYPGTKVIVADDFNPSYPAQAPEAWLRLYDGGKNELITYIQVEEGISNGRNIALQLTTTEYALFVDDDHVFTDQSNISVLLRVLQYTDVTLAGGQFGNRRFDALARVTVVRTLLRSRVHLIWYPYIFYQTLEPFADCYVTDRVQNVFLAKRQDLIGAGGWDRKRKVMEHEDFFLTLRKKRKKTVYCPEVIFYHNDTDMALRTTRKNVREMYKKTLEVKWQFSDTYLCRPETYFISNHCKTPMKPAWKDDTQEQR